MILSKLPEDLFFKCKPEIMERGDDSQQPTKWTVALFYNLGHTTHEKSDQWSGLGRQPMQIQLATIVF